jgi:hypothetical protein
MDLHTLVSRLRDLYNQRNEVPSRAEYIASGVSDYAIREAGGYKAILRLAGIKDAPPPIPEEALERYEPRVLVLDIETSPILAFVYQLFDVNISVDQIVEDWHVMSWAAKWLGDPPDKVMYADTRDTPKDDSGILSQIWQLMDEADIILGQNSKRFDTKKLNARFLLKGLPPPSSYRHVDTMLLAKSVAAFTSNKLAYTSEQLCTTYKKLEHGKYPGFSLWRECYLNPGNTECWEEMRLYNMHDVLATEEYYLKLRPFDKKINWNAFTETFTNRCACGSTDFKRHERDKVTNSGRFARYICQAPGCGAEYHDKGNLLSKEKRASLRELGV